MEILSHNNVDIQQNNEATTTKNFKIGKATTHDKLVPEMMNFMGNAGLEVQHRVSQLAWRFPKILAWQIATGRKCCENYYGVFLPYLAEKSVIR